MKHKHFKSIIYWLIVFGGYILSTLFLVALIFVYPLGQQLNIFKNLSSSLIDELISGNYDNINMPDDVGKIFYSPDGSVVVDYYDDPQWLLLAIPDNKFSDIVQSSIVHGKCTTFYYSLSMNDLVLIRASTKNTVSGPYTLVFLRNIKNLPEATIGMVSGYTILYIIFVIFLIFWRRKKKQMELLQKNYVANITHSLKAPIASVQALTEALVDVVPPDPDQQHPYFEMILKATKTQSHMVSEILTLSRLQNKTLDTSKTHVTTEELFSQIFSEYESMCECSGINFNIDDSMNEVRSVRLHTNAACIKQVMEILLENAVKYLDINGRGITISAQHLNKFLIICVNDEGSVISASDLPHVFEQFYVGENGKGRQSSGLGLPIAKATCEILQEKIWIESNDVSGTSAYFTIHK